MLDKLSQGVIEEERNRSTTCPQVLWLHKEGTFKVVLQKILKRQKGRDVVGRAFRNE
jgi:hypothetical protein